MWNLFGRRDTIRRLMDELEMVKRELGSLKFQMLDVLDKTQRWMNRSIKRAERASQEVEGDEAAVSRTDGAVSGGVGTDPISQEILRRRNRLPPKPE